jgi:NAD(P)-dependent dehydrogenase (short-subunit alcohol dehydrogenase family)
VTKAAALGYAAAGIRVNALAPGIRDTPMTKGWLDDPTRREAAGNAVVAIGQAGLNLRSVDPQALLGRGEYRVRDRHAKVTAPSIPTVRGSGARPHPICVTQPPLPAALWARSW